MRAVPAVALVLLGAWPAPESMAQTYDRYAVAVLGGTDKVTGRVRTFEVEVGATARHGTLRITPRSCRKTPPEEPPESASFLQIDDLGEFPGARVFSGWMFSSSPGVSALEHPVYDIWVLDCAEAPSGTASRE